MQQFVTKRRRKKSSAIFPHSIYEFDVRTHFCELTALVTTTTTISCVYNQHNGKMTACLKERSLPQPAVKVQLSLTPIETQAA